MRADFTKLNFKFMSLDAFLTADNLRFSKFALRFAVDYAYIFLRRILLLLKLSKQTIFKLAPNDK